MRPFAPDDAVRIWKPRHAEHGLAGIILFLDGDGMAWPVDAWAKAEACVRGPWPIAGLVHEDDYRRRRRTDPNGRLWRE